MINLFRPYVSNSARLAVDDVLQSGWIGQGPKVEEFEAAFAAYVGTEFAVAVNSATAALHMALLAHGIEEGDEVITTPISFVSTNHVILHVGAQPIFADVEENTLNLDLHKLQEHPEVLKRAKFLMVVHYAGNPLDMDLLEEIADEYGLIVIEDAAHACGAFYKDRRIGSFNTTCFSFQAVKNLPVGDGGMLTTNDRHIYEEARKLRWLGINRSTFDRSQSTGYNWEYDVPLTGFKCHMNDISAAIGLAHLKEVDEWNDTRAEIVDVYRKHLSPHAGINFLELNSDGQSSHHLCVIKVQNRDKVYDSLRCLEVSCGVHYRPNHHYDMYKGCETLGLETTEKVYREILSIPLHLDLSRGHINKVILNLKNVVPA